MKKHEKYPTIKKVALGIAAVNGAINRDEPAHVALDTLEECLGASGVYENDLQLLENWLLTLTPEQLDLLEDGEQTEIDELVKQSPLSSTEKHTAHIFTDFWENL
jgi:hypothetical protein